MSRVSSAAINLTLLLLAMGATVAWLRDQSNRKTSEPNEVPAPTVKSSPVLEAPKEPFDEVEMVQYRQIIVSHSTGDFSGAVSLMDRLLDNHKISENFREWLIRQKPILLTSLAWTKIKSQDCDDAVKIFYRALAISPVIEAQKGIGYCLRVMKNWPEAASYLALYVLAKPADVEGRLMYADTLESLGRYDEAVSILEGAPTLADATSEMKELAKQRLTAMRAKAKSGAGQKTERSENFFVSYHEDSHDGILKQVLEILEAGMSEYSSLLGVTPPANPIEVILYRKEDFVDVIPGGPGWAEGAFDGRMRVPVSPDMLGDVNGRLAIILRHELSHAVLSNRSGGRPWPTWFDEGLAQYLACRGRTCESFKFPAKLSSFSTVARLTHPFVTLDDIDASTAYLHSLYIVQGIFRSKGDAWLDLLSSRLPVNGPVTSDFIAETLGWSSFDELWGLAGERWSQKLQP